ncbi:hypothetical protein N7G274_008511 [Stereocaulon virgatum]|uniref:BZIP domain-containing protein n=1 Tax=Stereocaulon virgatum TaxID=373712 RepID=A0ABR4A5X5_9LECA
MAFSQENYHPPQATVSLSETSLEDSLMTPGITSPESSYSTKEEPVEGEESKKPTKKRKSWGQELPTPKTNLPPRKRAKTEDEKEQRRIERVLRNRQAAQSSRERKRQEVEKLEGEKQSIEQQNESLKQRLMAAEHEKFLLHQRVAKMEAQMDIMRRGSSLPNLSTPPIGPDHLEHSPIIKQEFDDYHHFSLPTPQSTHHTTSIFSSPTTATYSEPSTPATIGLGLNTLTSSTDMTQHPAAMLCDLQCQSMEVCQVSTQPTTHQAAATHLYIPSLVYLTLTSAVYSQLILPPLRIIFTSLKTNSPLPERMMTSMPMALPLIRWLILTPANLPSPRTTRIPRMMTTSLPTAMSTPANSPQRATILRPRLLRRLLLSSPSLARPLRAATGRASRLKTVSTADGNRAQRTIVHWVGRQSRKAGLGSGVHSLRRIREARITYSNRSGLWNKKR